MAVKGGPRCGVGWRLRAPGSGPRGSQTPSPKRELTADVRAIAGLFARRAYWPIGYPRPPRAAKARPPRSPDRFRSCRACRTAFIADSGVSQLPRIQGDEKGSKRDCRPERPARSWRLNWGLSFSCASSESTRASRSTSSRTWGWPASRRYPRSTAAGRMAALSFAGAFGHMRARRRSVSVARGDTPRRRARTKRSPESASKKS